MNASRNASVMGVLLVVFTCANPLVSHGAEAPAAKPKAKSSAPNLEFLEYLGTLESDEENWTDIANVDVARPPTSKSVGKRGVDKSAPIKETPSKDKSSKDQPTVEAAEKSASNEK